jgi:hypothetical protein
MLNAVHKYSMLNVHSKYIYRIYRKYSMLNSFHLNHGPGEKKSLKSSNVRKQEEGLWAARTLSPAPAGRINSVVAEPQGRRGERPMYLRGWKIDARTRTQACQQYRLRR